MVLYHLSLIARPFLSRGDTSTAWQLATETPAKLAFAGTEAVLVFFVLSGLVVVLPALREGFSWAGFLVSRAVRLYLPVWGALLFAALLIALLPRDPARVADGEWIVDANARTLDAGQLLAEASLTPASYDVVNVLWSLRWELVFTLLLPLFVVIAVVGRRHVALLGALALGGTILGRILDLEALVYLPVFLLGSLIAVRLDDFRRWAAARPRPLLWGLGGAASAAMLIASWLGRPIAESDSLLGRTLWGLAGVGAVGIILVAIGSPAISRLLEARVSQWLGRVSFSLYLVHVPIIASVAFLTGDERWWLVAAISVPLSLLAAELFHRVVERPSHRLARQVGRRVGRASAALRPPRDAAEPARSASGSPGR